MSPGHDIAVGADATGSLIPEQAECLRQQGYIILRGVLDEALCKKLREHVLLSTDEAAHQKRHDLFGSIQEADLRYDLKLDLCSPVVEALNNFVTRCGPLLTAVTGGRTGLVELAAISSDGGALAQPVHADTTHGIMRFLQSNPGDSCDPMAAATEAALLIGGDDEDADEDIHEVVKAVATETAKIFTSLLALQDVDEEMGPTQVWPATHTMEHHTTLWNNVGKLNNWEADKAFGIEHKKMTLSQGDLVLYDSRVMHCGGANTSLKRRRSVLCVSAMGPGIRPDGTTWTMLDSLRNKLLLSDFPLSCDMVRASTATTSDNAAAALPPLSVATAEEPKKLAKEPEGKPMPPLEEWKACVQCTGCSRWRPCDVMEGPTFTNSEGGFRCRIAGFSCAQEGFTKDEIDASFE